MDNPEPRARRRRRTQSEVMQRIVEAARAQFSERGYVATTTRDIARAADVSETLLFRHFGTKSGLFDHVCFEPFDAIADQFLDEAHTPAPDLEALGAESLRAFLAFLDGNRQMLTTLAVKGLADTNDGRAADRLAQIRLAQMQHHYARAAEKVRQEYAAAGAELEIAPELAVRLGFGMVLASSLFSEWLFQDGVPDRELLTQGIQHMLEKALAPPVRQPD